MKLDIQLWCEPQALIVDTGVSSIQETTNYDYGCVLYSGFGNRGRSRKRNWLYDTSSNTINCSVLYANLQSQVVVAVLFMPELTPEAAEEGILGSLSLSLASMVYTSNPYALEFDFDFDFWLALILHSCATPTAESSIMAWWKLFVLCYVSTI